MAILELSKPLKPQKKLLPLFETNVRLKKVEQLSIKNNKTYHTIDSFKGNNLDTSTPRKSLQFQSRIKAVKSNWIEDKAFEEKCIEYLDKETDIINYLKGEIIVDKKRQLQGIDIIGRVGDKQVTIDVKSIASFNFPTFCFEISGNIQTNQIGWLLNPKVITDYYLLTYHEIKNAGNDYKLGKSYFIKGHKPIKNMAILISKREVIKIIRQQVAYDLNDAVKKIRSIQYTSKDSSIKSFDTTLNPIKNKKNHNLWFSLSLGIREKPINIVIRKEMLIKHAYKTWIFQ